MRILVFLFALCLSACNKPADPVKDAATTSIGRFQVMQLGTFRRDQFMIDSATGRIWQNQCFKNGKALADCDYNVWVEQDVMGVNASAQEVSAKLSAMNSK